MGRQKAALSPYRGALRADLSPRPRPGSQIHGQDRLRSCLPSRRGAGNRAARQPQGGHPKNLRGGARRFFGRDLGKPNLASLDPACRPCWLRFYALPLASVRTQACSVRASGGAVFIRWICGLRGWGWMRPVGRPRAFGARHEAEYKAAEASSNVSILLTVWYSIVW